MDGRTDPRGWRVLDAAGNRLVYVYGFKPDDRGAVRDMLPIDSARAVAEAIADLPQALQGRPARPLPAVGAYTVEDRNTWFALTYTRGYRIACVYCDDPRAGDLTRDEARRIAGGIIKLPTAMQKHRSRGSNRAGAS